MMKVGSMNGASLQGAGGGIQAGSAGMQNDSVSRNIREQIANAQKRLQEISSNQDMTLEEKMKIIFVTALDDFVFEAFDVGAFHYLVKPFHNAKFAEVLFRAVQQHEEIRKQETAERAQDRQRLTITSGRQHFTVIPEDIVYAEVFDRKIIIHTMDQDIEYYGKMKDLEQKAGDEFYRPHRAYLVNFNFIRKYDATTIYLKKGQALMAKQNYGEFVKCYLRFIRKKGRE